MSAIGEGKIRLRVVGVYYDDQIDVSNLKKTFGGKSSIKDLLDAAAVKSMQNFNYRAEEDEMGFVKSPILISEFMHRLSATVTTLSGYTRAAGIYSIAEIQSADDRVKYAWQYYLVRKGQVFSNAYKNKVNNPTVSPAFPQEPDTKMGFTRPDKVEVIGGDEVIWRNVAVAVLPK